MNSKIVILFGFVFLATVQSVPINPFYYGLKRFDFDDDLTTKMLGKDLIYGKYGFRDDDFMVRRLIGKYDFDDDMTKTDLMLGGVRDMGVFDNDFSMGVFDNELRGDVFGDTIDKKVIKDLIRLDITHRTLVKRLLTLDVTGRKIVGDLAREINHIIFKKGKMYPLTLWDRVLKVKGYDTFAVDVNRGIFDKYMETEFEDKEVLKELLKLDTVDRRLVKSLLFTDVYDRKKVADLADVINVLTLKRGKMYPIVLLDSHENKRRLLPS